MKEFYTEGVPEELVVRDAEYGEKLRDATVVKGMRRTGKTFLTYQRMQQLLREGVPLGRIVHVNFEDERLKGLRAEDLHLINEVHAELYPECVDQLCWYFLDELQNVRGWEGYARRLLDAPKVQLWLTGSSSKLLSEEIATEMRGRSLPVEVFPLSFSEYLRFNGIFKTPPNANGVYTVREKGMLRKAASEYLERGGFPDVQDVSARQRAEMLQGYVDAVLYRDILERHQVTNIQALRYMLDYLFHNFARKVSTRAANGVLKNLGVSASRETLSEYLGYFKDAYLVYPVSIHSDSLAVKRVNPDKYYMIDTGLIRAMCVKNDAEKGWLLENMVYMSLRRQAKKVEYYLTNDGREVDFYVLDKVTHQEQLVQVAWNMSDDATFAREKEALLAAREESGIEDCSIVTWDDELEYEGIKVVPIWKFAL